VIQCRQLKRLFSPLVSDNQPCWRRENSPHTARPACVQDCQLQEMLAKAESPAKQAASCLISCAAGSLCGGARSRQAGAGHAPLRTCKLIRRHGAARRPGSGRNGRPAKATLVATPAVAYLNAPHSGAGVTRGRLAENRERLTFGSRRGAGGDGPGASLPVGPLGGLRSNRNSPSQWPEPKGGQRS